MLFLSDGIYMNPGSFWPGWQWFLSSSKCLKSLYCNEELRYWVPTELPSMVPLLVDLIKIAVFVFIPEEREQYYPGFYKEGI